MTTEQPMKEGRVIVVDYVTDERGLALLKRACTEMERKSRRRPRRAYADWIVPGIYETPPTTKGRE